MALRRSTRFDASVSVASAALDASVSVASAALDSSRCLLLDLQCDSGPPPASDRLIPAKFLRQVRLKAGILALVWTSASDGVQLTRFLVQTKRRFDSRTLGDAGMHLPGFFDLLQS